MRMTVRSGLLAAALVLTTHPPASAGEVRALAANALKAPLQELASAFGAASGHRVTIAWGGTEGIVRRVNDGEQVDIVLIGSDGLDRLIANGRLVAATRAEFVRSGVGVAVRAGLPAPNLSTAEFVREALLAAPSIAYSSGPSGVHVAAMIRRMGIADRVAHKVIQPASGVQVAELLARGEADIGFQQVSELLHAKGITYLGPLPPEIQVVTVYALALAPSAVGSDAATGLARFLVGPDVAAVAAGAGLEPGRNP
jgi:molybdate transport system substrate-binding protein